MRSVKYDPSTRGTYEPSACDFIFSFSRCFAALACCFTLSASCFSGDLESQFLFLLSIFLLLFCFACPLLLTLCFIFCIFLGCLSLPCSQLLSQPDLFLFSLVLAFLSFSAYLTVWTDSFVSATMFHFSLRQVCRSKKM
ncbi:hypothetical protein EDB82DRAFT_329553 [Fusarium venenatum]|uniref:uncharacterized protein n=1 Tax=Fusarium venenatum TaxID=56646 RepID=UPI001D301E8A|nr:hypothetical protein EDB82DRAFT_329553 [Fusarium venenatum]